MRPRTFEIRRSIIASTFREEFVAMLGEHSLDYEEPMLD
jgi:hypothetical protein